MKRRLLVAVTAIAVGLVAAPAPAQFQDTFFVVSPHTFTIVARRGSQVSVGTGVAVTGGAIVTAAHVIPDRPTRILVGRQGPVRDGLMTQASLVTADRNADVAILKTATHTTGLPLVELPVASGEELWVFGYEYHSDAGRMVAILRMARASVGQRWRDFFQVDGAFQKGFSGGPLVTRGGRVAGILSFSTPQTMSLAYMVPAHEIIRLLQPFTSQTGQAPARPEHDPARSLAIVPGASLGPVVLGTTTLFDLAATFGSCKDLMSPEQVQESVCYLTLPETRYRTPDGKAALLFVTYNRRTNIITAVSTNAVQFRTARGNSVGTPLTPWLAEFGPPDEERPEERPMLYKWSRRGLSVIAMDGLVRIVEVFMPNR